MVNTCRLNTTRAMYKQESTRIPRRKTEGLLEEVKLNSHEGQSILADIKRTCFDTNYDDKFWKIEKIEIVSNFVLEKRYEDKKRELKEQGRKGKELEEHLMFLSEQGYNLSTVVKDGCKTGTKKRHVLGYTKSGVHLHRNLDILMRFMTFKNFNSPGHMIVFKSILGRSKALKPMIKTTGVTYLEPTPNFDSHVSSDKVQPTMSVCEALNYTYVYFYEYDEDTGLPVVYPRHVVPYAVLTLCRLPGVIHGGPFLAVNSPNWKWEVKGETRNGFRWARVNTESPDSDTNFRRGKCKKMERSIPNKDMDHSQISMGLKGQSVSRDIKKYQGTNDDTSSHLKVSDLPEEVYIPSEENKTKDFSCSQMQLSNTISREHSQVNNMEKLIEMEIMPLSESRCHGNNLPLADECTRANNEGSQERCGQDKFGDKLCQHSSSFSSMKTSETDSKDDMINEEKDQKSNNSNATNLQTNSMNGPCRKPALFHNHASSLTTSSITDCPVQVYTEEMMRQARAALLNNRSIHTSSISSIPYSLINPRVYLHRLDENHLKSQQKDYCCFVRDNSSLSTSVSSTKTKEEYMSPPVKMEVLTTVESDSNHLECYSKTNPTLFTRMSPEHLGAFHFTSQLKHELGRSKESISPSTPAGISPSTPAGISLSTQAGISPSTPAGISLSTQAGISPSTPAGISLSTQAGISPSTPAGISLSTQAGISPSTPAGISPSTSPPVSQKTSCVIGVLQKQSFKELCLDSRNSASSSVISSTAKEDISSFVKLDLNTAEMSDVNTSNSDINPACCHRIVPDNVSIYHYRTDLPLEQERQQINASQFVSYDTSYVVGQLQKLQSEECCLNAGNSSLLTNLISVNADEDMSSPVKVEVYTTKMSDACNTKNNSNQDSRVSTGQSPKQVCVFYSNIQHSREQERLETSSLFVSPETSCIIGQLQASPRKETFLNVGLSSVSTSVFSDKVMEENTPSSVKNEVHIAAKVDLVNKQWNPNRDSAYSHEKSSTQLSCELVKLETSTLPFVSQEMYNVAGQSKQSPSPSKESCSDEGITLSPTNIISAKSVEDMSLSVKKDVNTYEKSYLDNKHNNSYPDQTCCTRMVPEIINSNTQMPFEEGILETRTKPFVTLGQFPKPSLNCSLDLGNISVSTSAFCEKAKEENISFSVKNDALAAVKSNSVSQQYNYNTFPTFFARRSPEQVDGFFSGTHLPSEQGTHSTSEQARSETISQVGQLQMPPSTISCVPQKAYRPSTLVNMNSKKQSSATANERDMNETSSKEDTVDNGIEAVGSVCTKETDIDTLSNIRRSKNLQTYSDCIVSTPSFDTRLQIRQDTVDISVRDSGKTAHHIGYNQVGSVRTTKCHGTDIKHEDNTQFNRSSPFPANTISSYSQQPASVKHKIPWKEYHNQIRGNCTPSDQNNISAHKYSNTLHIAQTNTIKDMKNPINLGLFCTESKAEKTQNLSSSSSLCTVAEKIVSVNNSLALSEFQTPALTKEHNGSVFSPNLALFRHDLQSVDSMKRGIFSSEDVSTFDRYIIEKAWKRLGNGKQTPETNISANEMPRIPCDDNSNNSYSYTHIHEISNLKVPKDPRLRPRSNIYLKNASNTFSHENKDTDRTLKEYGNVCSLSPDKEEYTGTFAEFRKVNDTDHGQIRASEEEHSDGTPTRDEKDYSAESDFIQGVGHDSISTLSIRPKETDVDIVKSMGSCTRVNESVVVDTKGIDSSQQILVTLPKDVTIKSKSSCLREKGEKKKTQVNSNSSKQDLVGHQINNYQKEITKTLLELSAIVNAIQLRQEQTSKTKEEKSPIMGAVTVGQNIEKREAPVSNMCSSSGEKQILDTYNPTHSLGKDNNYVESIQPIHSLSSTKVDDARTVISETKNGTNRSKKGNKSLSFIRRYNEKAVNKYKFIPLSVKNDLKKVYCQLSLKADTPSSSKDQCVSANEATLQTSLHKSKFPVGCDKGGPTAKENIKSLEASIKTTESEKRCTGMTGETCSIVKSQPQDKPPCSNMSTVTTMEENIHFDKTTNLLDMACKWRPIPPAVDSKPREMDISGTHSNNSQGQNICDSKPSVNRSKQVDVDRKSNVQIGTLIQSKHVFKDAAYNKTNSPIVLSPPVNPAVSPTYDLTFKHCERTSENCLSNVSIADAVDNAKDAGRSCDKSIASKIRSDSRTESNYVSNRKSPPYSDSSSDKEPIHCNKRGVTNSSTSKGSQLSNELVTERPTCFSQNVSSTKFKRNEDSNFLCDNVESSVRKPKVRNSFSNCKVTDAPGSNSVDRKKPKAVQSMDINSNPDANEIKDSEPKNKREPLLTDLTICDGLRNKQGLNRRLYSCGSESVLKVAKIIREQSLHQEKDNNHRKKLNRFATKTMNAARKQLNSYSSGVKDTNISMQETYRIMRDKCTNIGAQTEMNERKTVDIIQTEETLTGMKFQGKERLKINSSNEDIQRARGRDIRRHQCFIENKGVKQNVRQNIERSSRSASTGEGSDENEVSCRNKVNRRKPFIAYEKESREKSTSSVRSNSSSSDFELKRRRCDDTKLNRNEKRSISVSSFDKHSSASSHSRNSSLSLSVSDSRNDKESSYELSPIRDSGYIPPRYLNPNFKLKKTFVKQGVSHFHKHYQKQYIEKQKQKVFRRCKYAENFGPKSRDFYKNDRRFMYFKNLNKRRKYDFPEIRGSNLDINGPGSKHHETCFTESDGEFQTRPFKRFVHLPVNTYRNPLEKVFLSRKKIYYENYANRDVNNENDYYQRPKPLNEYTGFYEVSKKQWYSKLNGHSNGWYSKRGFNSMRVKRTHEDDDTEDEDYVDHEIKNGKRRKMFGYNVHVDDTEQTTTNIRSMNAKRKQEVKKQTFSLDIRSRAGEKKNSMNNFPGGKSKLNMDNDKQTGQRRLKHSLYKDKFGALHETLGIPCSKQHVESHAESLHLSKKDQISNLDDPDRSVRPRIRLRERIFDALERYRNAFESSDPSEVDEEIVRCLNFLCKKIDVSAGTDSDTPDHLNRQSRQNNKYLERVLQTYPQTVHRQKVAFYEHVLNTIRLMQQHASILNMPNSLEVVRSQFSLGRNEPTMKYQIPAKLKYKRSQMNKQMRMLQNQRAKKHKKNLQMKRRANFDFVNTNFRHRMTYIGKQFTGTKMKQKC